MLGKKATMLCTASVEEVIDEHYKSQQEKLKNNTKEKKLFKLITKFRDEEIEHKNTALEHNAKDIKGYKVMTQGIKSITKLAIFLSKKI